MWLTFQSFVCLLFVDQVETFFCCFLLVIPVFTFTDPNMIVFVFIFINVQVCIAFGLNDFFESISERPQLFKHSSCYRQRCGHSYINVLKLLQDRVTCHEYSDNTCNCCLKRSLHFDQLEKLNQDVIRLSKPNKASCKIYNCGDYQVKILQSLESNSVNCVSQGYKCKCCVNINSSHIASNTHYNLPEPLKREEPLSQVKPNFENDQDFNLDCFNHNCDEVQVKALKKIDSNVIDCQSIGSSHKCRCCFNQNLSLFDRIKYEILVPFVVESEKNNQALSQSKDCSYHDCQSNLVQLISQFSNSFAACMPQNGRCRCCLNQRFFNDFNLDFDKFFNF